MRPSVMRFLVAAALISAWVIAITTTGPRAQNGSPPPNPQRIQSNTGAVGGAPDYQDNSATNPLYVVGGTAPSGTATGNVGALTKSVCLNPTVTNGTYAANVVIGGLLTFSNIFTAQHSGTIQEVDLNFTSTQTVGFIFYPFRGSPTNASTWTDHSAAAISGFTDISLTKNPVPLGNATSNLGAGTNYGATGLGEPIVGADANIYGVLLPTATTASLGGTTSVVNICVVILQDN